MENEIRMPKQNPTDLDIDKQYVNHPKHYNKGKIECIDAMLSSKGIFRTIAFCDTNVFKYNYRQGNKDDEVQEIAKQQWYLNKQQQLLNKINSNNEAKLCYLAINELCNKLDEFINNTKKK